MKIQVYILSISLFALTFSCKKNPTSPITPKLGKNYTLQEFIDASPHLVIVRNELLACAAGGQSGILTNDSISIFYYPLPGAEQVRYFESSTVDISESDLSYYRIKELPIKPVFNGKLERMPRGSISEDIWSLVTYQIDNKLYICDPIRLKLATKPTQFAPELLSINLTIPTEPVFSWTDGTIPENVIYFEVVSDLSENIVSGTYTTDRFWQFYKLSNVTINIHDISPSPTLMPNQNYTFTLMGVSEDNWVNLIISTNFTTKNE